MESFRYGLGASDMGRDCGVVMGGGRDRGGYHH